MITKPDPPEDFVSLEEAAKLLAVRRSTLYNRLLRADLQELRPAKIFGRWRIPLAAIHALYERAQRQTTGKALPPLTRNQFSDQARQPLERIVGEALPPPTRKTARRRRKPKK